MEDSVEMAVTSSPIKADVFELSPLLPSFANAAVVQREQTRRLLTVVLCALSTILYLPNSLMGPFFPGEAHQRGASHSSIGVIIGVFSLALLCSGSMFGGMISRFGPNLILMIGGISIGICCLLFAFVDLFQGTDFVAFCVLIRFPQGLGSAAVTCASMAFIGEIFPLSEVGKVSGLLEMFSSLGFIIGPFFGGLLIEWKGFRAPFLVFGVCILLVMLPLCWIPTTRDAASPTWASVKVRDILFVPGAPLILSAYTMGMMAMSFLDIALQPILNVHELTVSSIGGVFAVSSAVYAIASLAVGLLTTPKNTFTLMGCGLLTMTCSLSMLYPIGTKPFHMWIQFIAVPILNIGYAFSVIPVQSLMLDLTRQLGQGSSDVLAGVLTAANGLGQLLGTFVGGILLDYIGIGATCALYSWILFICAVAVLRLVTPRRRIKTRPDTVDLTPKVNSKTHNL